MNHSVLRRTLCIREKANAHFGSHHTTWRRPISTTSAIKKGLRAGRESNDRPDRRNTPSRIPSSRLDRQSISDRKTSSSRTSRQWDQPGLPRDRPPSGGRNGRNDRSQSTREGVYNRLKSDIQETTDARPGRPRLAISRVVTPTTSERVFKIPRMPLSALHVDGEARKAGSKRTAVERSPFGEREAGEDFAVGSDRPGGHPRKRLLQAITILCKNMVHVQRLEGSRGPRRLLDRLKSNIRGHIRAINVAIETGTFKTEAEDSVAEMFMRKADDRIFRVGPPAGPTSSTIYQKEDGTMDVYYASEAFEFGKYGKEVDFGNEEVAETPQKQSQDEPEQTSQSSQDHIPVPIPYSTAASEFLYGYNPVLAALRGRRRKMYKLYIHPHIFPKDFAKEPTGPVNQVESARANLATLARDANVTLVNKVITQQLDRMSDGRPHNGVVLEVSKLPAPPVLHLSKPDLKQSSVRMELAKQSAEEAAVNGTSNEMQIAAKTWRYPLVVMLDGILDPANVGSIIRTCHFYGVDAVAVATNTCANLSSPIVAKASSGGCEAVRLLSLPKPSEFVYESGRNGWSIYAAEASSAGSADKTRKLTTSSVAADSPLAKHPCILMLGAEGEGLRENLRKRADGFVAIQSSAKPADMGNVGVDSLNVGVAAGILLESFLSRPAAAPKEKDISGELGW